MLVGYVSDERYVALAGVQLEFHGPHGSTEAHSRASGAVEVDLLPGPYRVTLQHPGFGAKQVDMTIGDGPPHQFRLLRDGLLGYAWPKWVRSGEKSEFRVHAVEAYKLELFRYGYHKELVQPLGWYDEHGPRATMQITPDGDYTQTGVQWNRLGYSSPHHKQFVTSPPRSGLYYFHATGESGQFFAFPWIVAPAQPRHKLAVLLANINWNAYNSFGGRSNYIHPDRFPATPTINARLELKRYTDPEHINYDTEDYSPLSFDRPEPINHIPRDVQVTDPIEGRAACHVAPAEWRLLGWLEREGIDCDVYAETQLHSGLLNLDQYRVLLISTHPEYWTREMYLAVKRWVFERGGRLIYLGGNGLNCLVEMISPTAMIVRNGDARRQKQLGLESRLHDKLESEANLLGVVYDARGIMTASPYQVIDADHWVFANTGLRQGDRFGERSQHMRVPGGASGHETDKISPSSPANVHLLAQGLNADQGGAQMVLHRPEGGGAVFSAGSINYVSSLLVDEGVSTITRNVVLRFLDDLP